MGGLVRRCGEPMRVSEEGLPNREREVPGQNKTKFSTSEVTSAQYSDESAVWREFRWGTEV